MAMSLSKEMALFFSSLPRLQISYRSGGPVETLIDHVHAMCLGAGASDFFPWDCIRKRKHNIIGHDDRNAVKDHSLSPQGHSHEIQCSNLKSMQLLPCIVSAHTPQAHSRCHRKVPGSKRRLSVECRGKSSELAFSTEERRME
jgi:hypothetical protein